MSPHPGGRERSCWTLKTRQLRLEITLEQRITVRYQMKGMTPGETAGYIRHHLEQAGRTADLFTDEAITQIHQAARGKPRTVNNIAIAALIATAGAGKNLVDHASARAAIAEVTATG